MSVTVPCIPSGQPSWSQLTALDGVTYTLAFRWNQRDGRWLLDLADGEGSPIRSGMMLGTNTVPLRGCVDARRPAGELVIVDTTGANDVDPGFDDLGARFVLLYFSATEVAAARASA